MGTALRTGTLSDAIESVTTMDIVEAFGVPYQIRRGRTYLLCPGHDDTHFGSCYIDKNDNGYYCYVCGEQVTKWYMVLLLNGNKKKDAAEWFFKTAGITPAQESSHIEDPIKKVNRLIQKVDGFIKNKVVYNDFYTCEKKESSYGKRLQGEYLYSEMAITNPLVELYKTNKPAFKELMYRKVDAEIQKRNKKQVEFDKKPEEIFDLKEGGQLSFGELKIGTDVSVQFLQNLIVEINEL